MTEVTRRRADQLRDLVRMLKLRAVNLRDQIRITKKYFRGGLDDSRLAGTCGTKEEQVPDWTAGVSQSSQKDLIQAGDASHSAILSDDQRGKLILKLLSRWAFQVWIEINGTRSCFLSGSHHLLLSLYFFTLKMVSRFNRHN